jgi:carboxylesterase type B
MELSDGVVYRVHGDSFIAGGATRPGLDGSRLATATGSIVAVIQYRLGAVSLSSRFLTNHLNFGLVGLPRT